MDWEQSEIKKRPEEGACTLGRSIFISGMPALSLHKPLVVEKNIHLLKIVLQFRNFKSIILNNIHLGGEYNERFSDEL